MYTVYISTDIYLLLHMKTAPPTYRRHCCRAVNLLIDRKVQLSPGLPYSSVCEAVLAGFGIHAIEAIEHLCFPLEDLLQRLATSHGTGVTLDQAVVRYCVSEYVHPYTCCCH